jgi:threonine/homoserine/homoserine lactone efflux protein
MMMIEGMLLGLVYVLTPGPVTTETVRRSLRGGAQAALAVQLGAVGGDLIYAILVMIGLSNFLTHTVVQPVAGLLGATLLLYLGVSALRGWDSFDDRDQLAPGRPDGAPASLWRQTGVGLIVSLLNPFAPGFWLTVGSTVAAFAPVWLAGFLLGSLVASLFTGIVVGKLPGSGVARYARWVSFGCGWVLIAFGFRLGWTMLSSLGPIAWRAV